MKFWSIRSTTSLSFNSTVICMLVGLSSPLFGDAELRVKEINKKVRDGNESVAITANDLQVALVTHMYSQHDNSPDSIVGNKAVELAEQIMSLSNEQMNLWHSVTPDVEGFVSSLQKTGNPGNTPPFENRSKTMASAPGTALQHLGPLDELGNAPDYPPDSGGYGDYLIEQLQIRALLPQVRPEANRCATALWGEYFKEYDIARKASNGLEEICISTAGDPIGVLQGPACAAYAIALAVTDYLENPIIQCDAHIGNVDSAEIQAAYRNTNRLITNTAHIHHDIEVVDGSLDAMETDIEEVLQETLAIRTDIANHNANIDGDLASHDTKIDHLIAVHDQNMVGRLTSHDNRLVNHDANIDADLAKHDADNKARLIWMQYTLDQKVELKRVHLQVVEVKNRDEYLVMTTESGRSVNVSFESIETFDTKADEFLILDESTVEHIEAGVYLVSLQPQPDSNGKIFRFKVRHGGAEDHLGQIVFHAEMRSASN
jgi:hypothetical protein